MIQGNVAMWYDATSAAGSLEAADSPVKGKIGYAPAPVKETASAGWLYAWSWGIQSASTKKDNAWKFVSWASGKKYEQLVGVQVGWSKVPAGKRASTYANPHQLDGAMQELVLPLIVRTGRCRLRKSDDKNDLHDLRVDEADELLRRCPRQRG